MKTSNAWYSVKAETKVYHNNTECTEGNNIESYNVREGTGGKAKCTHCANLDSEGGKLSFHPLFPINVFPGVGLSYGLLPPQTKQSK